MRCRHEEEAEGEEDRSAHEGFSMLLLLLLLWRRLVE